MINKRRVQRIKNLIYAVLILLFFLPVILISILSVKMFGIADDLTKFLAQNQTTITQTAPEASQESSSLQPKNQSVTPAPAKPNEEESSTPPASGQEPEAGGSPLEDTAVTNTYQPSTYTELYFDTLAPASTGSPHTLYLTFDNTPSSQGDEILAVLSKHQVPATFFVWWSQGQGAQNTDFYKQIVSAGHSIGIHSYSSAISFSQLYASTDTFLDEFSKIYQQIFEATGVKTRLYRLPGGSINPYLPDRQAVLFGIKTELDSRGFLQYDWNASAQDAVSPPLSKQQILSNIKNSINENGHAVILLHDGADSTVDALDEFIVSYKAAGYTFKALDYGTRPVSFLDNK